MLGYKALAKLGRKKYRQQYKAYLVEGKKTVLEAIDSGVGVIQLVTTVSFKQENPEYFAQKPIQQFVNSKKILEVGRSQFAEIADTTTPQGIAAVVNLPLFDLEQLLASSKTLAILEDIRDPGNLGTIIRTADWFGFDGLICLGGADPFQPKVVRSSMGSIFRLPLVHYGRSEVEENLSPIFEGLGKAGFTSFSTKPDAQVVDGQKNNKAPKPLPTLNQPKLCLIFGNEAHGISPKIDRLCDQSVSIAKVGRAESLNVAISFGILAAQRSSLK